MEDFTNLDGQGKLMPQVFKNVALNTQYTYNFTNNDSFYVMVPAPHSEFYSRWVKNALFYYNGYVPYLHNSTDGIFSTRIGTAIVQTVKDLVKGGRIMYKNTGIEVNNVNEKNKALDFVSTTWSKYSNFDSVMDKAIELSAAAGTSLLKLNASNGRLWADALRMDSFYVDVDFKGDIYNADIMVDTFKQTTSQYGQDKTIFFNLMEHRFYQKVSTPVLDKDGEPTGEVIIETLPHIEYLINRVSPQLGHGYVTNKMTSQRLKWESLPRAIRDRISDNFPEIMIDTPQILPFETLGLELVKWTSFVSNLPSLPFGESVLSMLFAYLISYDYYFSAMNTDIYLGRGRVMMPKKMGAKGKSGNYNSGLDSFMYSMYDATGTDKAAQPIPLQFDLRSSSWKEIRNNLLESISVNLRLNPSTLASFLTDNTARTATEVSTEEGGTALYVENKRSIMEGAFNKILREVTIYHDFEDIVEVRWSKAGTTNVTTLVDNIIKQWNAGLISLRKAVETINPDMDESQIAEEMTRILEGKQDMTSVFEE